MATPLTEGIDWFFVMDIALALIGLVVCPALLIAVVRTRVSRPLPAAFAAAMAVAVPWCMGTFVALVLRAMAHNKHAYHQKIFDMTLYGLLVLPSVAAIWMYAHKRGGGMRGLIVSAITTLATFLKFLRRWGLDGNVEQSLVASPDSDGSTSENSGDAE